MPVEFTARYLIRGSGGVAETDKLFFGMSREFLGAGKSCAQIHCIWKDLETTIFLLAYV